MIAATRRALVAGLAAAAVGCLATPTYAAAGSCRDVTVPVGLLGMDTMYGRLCEPPVATRTVLVLVPGATYTGGYWDLPAELGLHSFRRGMNDAGYATLVVDRLGTGRSSRPLSATVTGLTQAAAVHQVVGRLRNGSLGTRYERVIMGGHSLGAAIAVLEAANYHDVDGVLIASLAHHVDLVDATANLILALIPATVDTQLAGRGYDPGYLTTRAGTRWQAFHFPAAPAAQIIDHDERTKDVFATTEAADGLGVAAVTPYSALIDAPVLLALSSGDEIFCGPLATDCSSAETVRQQEDPYYSAPLETYLHPGGYGHSFNYSPNADQFQHAVAAWADRTVGR